MPGMNKMFPKSQKNFLHTCTRPLLLLLQCLSNINLDTAADIVKFLLKTYKMWQNSELFESIEKEMSSNIKRFFTNLTKNSSTKKRKDTQDKMDLIIQASTFNDNTEKSKACDFF